MSILTIAKLLLLVTFVGSSYGCPCCCQKKMKAVGLIPTYANKVCTTDIKIAFYNNFLEEKVDCGNGIQWSSTENEPLVTFDATDTNFCSNLTILLFDPDSYVSFTPYAQWLVANIRAEDLKNSDLSNADVLYSYVKPGLLYPPTVDSKRATPLELHRFTFFVYCQRFYIPPENFLDDNGRKQFNPKYFAFRYFLGNPQAANFFYVTLPDYDNNAYK